MPKINQLLTSVILGLVAITCFTGFRKAAYMSGDAIIAEMKEKHATKSEIELIKMIVVDEEGNTTIREFLSVIKPNNAGELRYLIRFLSPKEIAGVTLLTVEHKDEEPSQYLYLPAIGQPREITGSQQSGYFVGSDFTFNDLRKENGDEHAYYRLMDDQIEGQDVYAVMSAPAGLSVQTATGYANRILYIDKKEFNILKIEFYPEGSNAPIKTFQGYEYNSTEVDGPTKRPQKAVMNHHENSTTSILKVMKSRLNIDVEDAIFDPSTLNQWDSEREQKLLAIFEQASE